MKLYFPCLGCFSSSTSEVSWRSSDDSIPAGLEQIREDQIFSYDQLSAATDGFRPSCKIGEGGFGSVYKGKLEDGTVVAVKLLSKESEQGDKEFLSEITSISNVNHPNLVRLHGGCIDGPTRILVYDYMENNSLAQILHGGVKNRARLGWKIRREIGVGTARALAYIHEEVKPHIVHRDIKPSNILLDQNWSPKISDFGLSKLFPQNISHISTRVAGTLGYLAPEYAISGRLTRKSDVYSFGVLLLEIVTGRAAIYFDQSHGESFLAQKAWEMYKSQQLLQLVDPTLAMNGSFNFSDEGEQEVTRFLKVGLLCVQQKCGLRPHMSTVIKMMTGEFSIDDAHLSPPAFINNIMDVKIT